MFDPTTISMLQDVYVDLISQPPSPSEFTVEDALLDVWQLISLYWDSSGELEITEGNWAIQLAQPMGQEMSGLLTRKPIETIYDFHLLMRRLVNSLSGRNSFVIATQVATMLATWTTVDAQLDLASLIMTLDIKLQTFITL